MNVVGPCDSKTLQKFSYMKFMLKYLDFAHKKSTFKTNPENLPRDQYETVKYLKGNISPSCKIPVRMDSY